MAMPRLPTMPCCTRLMTCLAHALDLPGIQRIEATGYCAAGLASTITGSLRQTCRKSSVAVLRARLRRPLSRAARHQPRLRSLSSGTAARLPLDLPSPPSVPGTGATPRSGGGLNAQGGVVGASFAIGGINPLLKSPKSDVLVRYAGAEAYWLSCRERGLQRLPLLRHRRQRQLHRERFLWGGHQLLCG